MPQLVTVDRRREKRIEMDTPVYLFPNNNLSNVPAIFGRLINISQSGACVSLNESLPQHEFFYLRLMRPSLAVLELDVFSKVVWRRTGGNGSEHCALSFLNKTQEADFVIGEIIRVSDNGSPKTETIREADFFRQSKMQLQQAEKRSSSIAEIRDSDFDSFAKKASAIIKDSDKNIRLQVEGFFNKDVRQYHEDLSALFHALADGKIESEEIEKRLTILTNDLLLKGNALEGIVDKVSMKKIKQLFRELSGCWAYESPIVKMAYEKPRGYPGDYELFEIIYNNKPLAENNSIGFYWDKYFLNNTYTMAVRTRKNKMKNILQDLIENNNSSSSLRLLNIACGPCREIRELLSDPLLAYRANVCFTGLDNDEGSLKFSKSALDRIPPNITLRFLNENVLNLFRDNKYYDIIGQQDIIYILGLSEYLPDRIFRKLISFLSQLLNDKGMLVVTYKDKDISFPALAPDWFCDWAFIKRSKDDLVNVAKGLGSEKYSLKIEGEGTGCIFFLILTKT